MKRQHMKQSSKMNKRSTARTLAGALVVLGGLSVATLSHAKTASTSAGASSGTAKTTEARKGDNPASKKPGKARRRTTRRRPKASKKSTVVATTGTVSLSFTPANAKVFLDNSVRQGGSPLQLGGVAPGTHTLVLQAPGFAMLSRQVKVRAGEEIVLSLAMEKASANKARLDIVTSPAGAMISINGKEHGTSPLIALMLPPGKRYRFSASMPGYDSDSAEVVATAGKNLPVVLTLKKSSRAGKALKLALEVKGDAKRGRPLFAARCGSCHGPGKKAAKLDSKSRTAAQWSRYLASGRHAYRAPLRGHMNAKELGDIKAYLMSDSADTERAVAAGVR